jgi:RNA polymerase sigma factor (TIGR02999 family)
VEAAQSNLTVLMGRAAAGSRSAAEQLLPLVYNQLRALAQKQLAREGAGHTLQATALVHEAYLRLGADPNAHWDGRRHYFAAAAIAMRRILVERARQRRGPRHGGGRARMPLDDAAQIQADPSIPEPDWDALDRALTELQEKDPDLVQIVHLRYFAGLSIDQTAAALGVSPRSVDRDWKCARAWLLERVSATADARPPSDDPSGQRP